MKNTGDRRVGTVYLVGAGPGDPELLTLRARRLIDAADIVFYDALVNTDVLPLSGVECVFVGKRRGYRRYSQEEIQELLAEAALRGLTVVRLKGGDPFIFGRGGEEAIFLRSRAIPCEVVPGISAAFAAAASMQLPLTHRGVSASVSFSAGSPADRISHTRSDTRVFYMGAHTVRTILASAVAEGLSEDAPVALIHNASLPGERSWILPAREIIEGTTEFPSPLIVVVGEVVSLAARSEVPLAEVLSI